MANTSNSNCSSNWVLDMSMRSQLSSWEPSLDPLPYEPVLPQKNQVPPSNPRSNPSFIDDRAENQGENGREEEHGLGPMKEMMYKIAVMQPVEIDPTMIQKPQRKNIRVSDDPQSIAARHRRERISERIRILQRMVPGGTKMDTASMLDEAIHYVKFLKKQVQELQTNRHPLSIGVGIDYSAARNWAMAIGPMSRELGFMQGDGSTTMGHRVCFIGDDGSLVPSWFE